MILILWIAGWYFAMSLLTFCMYGWDKHRARVSKWRVKENTLHILELIGGWPGAWLAQRRFHHKWQKTAYMRIFWAIVTLHVLAWVIAIYLTVRR
jgi:uncharacterized membrane protein YsdA (DUF1294 family)